MSARLLEEINVAMKAVNEAEQAVNEAEQSVTTAKTEFVSRSKKVGLLLLEAKKLYPKVKDFQAFLSKVEGLHRSRAYDLIRLAGGRTTDAELKKDARERQAKSRAKKKQARPVPLLGSGDVSELEADSFRDVTESAEASAEKRKAENAAKEAMAAEIKDGARDAVKEVKRNILLGSTAEDLGNEDVLACFKHACDTWLPQLGAADLAAAISYFNEVVGRHMAPRRAYEDGRERMH